MTAVPFVLVDVFASRPLTGNPVAVIPDADGLEVVVQQAIAREFNQSETTFLHRPTRAGADWRLRSFTPDGSEVFGAGHNVLGAWLWLAGSGRLPAGQTRFVQEIGDDLLPVGIGHDADGRPVVTLDHSPPVFGATLTDTTEVAASLGLAPGQLGDRPPQVVSTGAGHLLVPVRGGGGPPPPGGDTGRGGAVVGGMGGEGCYLYSRDRGDASDAVAYTRFFNPTVGIPEDPATGTAAGPLVARLVADGDVADGSTVVVEQGHALGRPSRIRVGVAGDAVRISGSGVVAAEGTLHL